MKKLLILTRFPSEYEPQELAEAAKKKGIEPEIINYQDVEVGPGKIALPRNLRLNEFDYTIPRSAAHHQKKPLLKKKIALIKSLPEEVRCLNKETFLLYPKLGKIKQAEILSKNGLPTIPILEKPIFPAILKAEFGSHSRRVIRVENQKQANKVMQAYTGKWIYQPLIKSPVYWRVIVLGGKPLGIMERKTSERFVKTGEGEKTKIVKSKIEALAIKAVQLFKAEMAGVDLLAEKNKLMIIEVNRSPQFQIFEKMTGADVAGKIINYLTLALK